MTKKLLASLLLACTISLMGQTYKDDRRKARDVYSDTILSQSTGTIYGYATGPESKNLVLITSPPPQGSGKWSMAMVETLLSGAKAEWLNLGFRHVTFVQDVTKATPKSRRYTVRYRGDVVKTVVYELYHEERIP